MSRRARSSSPFCGCPDGYPGHPRARPSVASFSKSYQRWLLFVLMLVCTINYADRSVVASVAEPLRRELGIGDFQLGLLQGLSFALLYSILGIPFARLAERRNRVRIIAAATFVWSFMTALCGAAASYVQLLMVRVGVGVGEGRLHGAGELDSGRSLPPSSGAPSPRRS